MKTIARTLSQVHLRLLGLAAVLLIAAPPRADAQQAIGGLRIERTGHTATRLPGGKILVVGGENGSGAVRDSEVFDPASRTFTSATGLLTARADHTATRLPDGRLFVIGGRASGKLLDSTEFYDPETGVFSSGPALNHARAGHTATLLLDGRIAVIGGDPDGSVEVLDPAIGFFRLIEPRLAVARKFHAAVLLKSGDVLIAGGVASGGAVLNSAELLDTGDLTFFPISLSLHVARSRPTLRMLPDGKVQVIGGDPEATMELFNPDGGYFSSLAHPAANPALLAAALKTQTRTVALGHPLPMKLQGTAEFTATADDITDRSSYSLTEIPELNQALAVGGTTTSGKLKTNAALFASSAATVTTDKTDYSPGETVIITGTGWQPGETVTLNIHRDTNDPPDTVLTAVADAAGNIQTSEYIVLESDAGVSFLLTATGQTSGYTAQTSFTDASLSSAPLTIQDSTCTTNQTTFNQNDSVCAKTTVVVAGSGGAPDMWIQWYNPSSTLVRNTPFSSVTNGSTYTDVLPSANVPGTWTVKTCKQAAACNPGQTADTKTFTVVATFPITFDATPINGAADVAAATTVLSVTIGSDPAVSVTKGDLPKTFTVATGTNIQYSYLSPLASTTANKQFRWLSTAGTGSASGQTGQSSSGPGFALTATSTVTATYKAQWKQTFTHSGLTADATGTVVTVNGSPQTFAALPFSTFVDDGSTVTYAYADPVTSSVGKRYALTTPAPTPATGYTVSGANTVTGTYKIQYQLTFAQSGIGGDSTGSVVTVAAAAKTAGDLPFSDWFDNGSSVTYTYSDPVASTVTGKRYALTTPAPSPASPITVSAAATVTGTYKIQYQITFTQSGIGGDSTGTVVTVAASAKTEGDLPFSDWFDSGSSLIYAYSDPVASTVAGKRYALTTPAPAPVSPITVSASVTVTGTYKIQFQLTFTQSGIGGDSTGTVVTVAGTPKAAGDLPFTTDWLDSGSSLTYAYSDPVASTVAGKRYALTTPAPTPGSPITVSAPMTVTGTYKIQFQVTFAQSGINGDSTGTVVTVAGSPKTAAVLPFSDWFDSGSSLSYAYSDPVASSVSGKRYALTTPAPTPASGFMVSGTITITGSYKIQYQLTLAITGGVPGGLANIGGGTNGTFYDSGMNLNLTASTPVPDGVTKQWGFDNWSGDVPSPPNSANPVSITMNQARAVTGNYAYPTATFASNGAVGEGSLATISFTGQSHPFGGTPFHYAYACDNSSLASSTYTVNSTTQAFTTCTFNNNGTYTVRGRIIDKNNGYTEYQTNQIVTNVAPTVVSVTANPSVPIPISSSTVTVTANFTDPGTADTHTCDFAWDDGTTTTGIPGSTGSGSCSTSHTYAATGVYTVTVTVYDGDGGSATGTYQFVVVFDPSAGFVTAGGWINQPPDGFPALSGKANFGFVSKYKKGSNTPEGETEFQFKAGDINFHSSSYDVGSLVISGGKKASYRGSGTVNGVPDYKFLLIAYDGGAGDGVDKIRMKITRISDNQVVYDNRTNSSEDPDLSDLTVLGGGSIVIHK